MLNDSEQSELEKADALRDGQMVGQNVRTGQSVAVLSLRASSRPKRPASYPSPAAYFCLSKIYINKQNVVLQQIVACYQFPPCNHLKN